MTYRTTMGAIGGVMALALAAGPARAQDAPPKEFKPADGAAPAAAATTEAPKAPDKAQILFGNCKITFYGLLRVDAIYDDSRPNNTETIAWVLSEDRNAPAFLGAGTGNPTGAGRKNAEDFTIHPKLTRFGFDIDGGVIADIGNAKATGKFEIDFYAATPSESREEIRMRHAWLKLDWDGTFAVLAGQTADLISPLFPAVNLDLVMWGAGNLGDRRPQIRADFTPKLGADGKLLLQGMIGMTGANDGQDLNAVGAFGNTYRDGETSGAPTGQARAAIEWKVGAKRPLAVGLWGHRAQTDPDVPIGASGKRRFNSWAVGADAFVPIGDALWIQGEGWTGKLLTDVRGGIFQGVNTTTGTGIASSGGWIEVGAKVAPFLTLSAGASTDDPETDDLSTFQRSANKIFYGAAVFTFGNVTIGVEFLHWITQYRKLDSGIDNRGKLYLSLGF